MKKFLLSAALFLTVFITKAQWTDINASQSTTIANTVAIYLEGNNASVPPYNLCTIVNSTVQAPVTSTPINYNATSLTGWMGGAPVTAFKAFGFRVMSGGTLIGAGPIINVCTGPIGGWPVFMTYTISGVGSYTLKLTNPTTGTLRVELL